MKHSTKKIGRFLFGFIPDNDLIYRVCKQYVDRHNGENNYDIATNGELRFMQQVLPDCHMVFDVGANVGHWAALALQINPAIHLHCFEPSRRTFKLLTQNKFPANVVCSNFGLGAAEGEATLFVFGYNSELNSLYKREGLAQLSLQTYQEVVRLTTLDTYCDENRIDEIDFVKLDVEGYELEVIKGSSKLLREGRIKFIQFEYGGCSIDARVLLKDIWKQISDLNPNYTFYKMHPRHLTKIATYDQTFENFQHQNWVVMQNA